MAYNAEEKLPWLPEQEVPSASFVSQRASIPSELLIGLNFWAGGGLWFWNLALSDIKILQLSLEIRANGGKRTAGWFCEPWTQGHMD